MLPARSDQAGAGAAGERFGQEAVASAPEGAACCSGRGPGVRRRAIGAYHAPASVERQQRRRRYRLPCQGALRWRASFLARTVGSHRCRTVLKCKRPRRRTLELARLLVAQLGEAGLVVEEAGKLDDGGGAVAALQRGLGALSEKRDQSQNAIDAYRKYIELQPAAMDRLLIMRRIKNLEAKLAPAVQKQQ